MTITVVAYDPEWPQTFAKLRDQVWPAVREAVLAIEHVGSTSVPGLAAKPVIDISVVVGDTADVATAITGLAKLGYVHRGNLGIAGREAFHAPPGTLAHHLYVCPQGSLGLRNHLAFRDYLRTHPAAVQAYGELKQRLARQFADNIDGYVDGKTEFILAILAQAELTSAELESIGRANRLDSSSGGKAE
ncbi:dephospho-CoA kinase/protein folding accessory domain-containing protein [Lignipirellula cremea]|uniref:Dephospho-CoA kinase/protein folding accessory domain-containing protein n=2 Tax=Lignipirellula cremea TaxID=2528010 RepID=A0A518DP85_9BACT|nr:dephospho-CoA kinase/protein folding accessory domain-containing protein [Lignipirellula cremea]